jgi:hypothetical protein
MSLESTDFKKATADSSVTFEDKTESQPSH